MTHPTAAVRSVRPTTLGGRVLVWPIIAYRRWLSPALPARCRFYPSCSAYALEAIARHGASRGTGLAVWRLLRCHPFHPGGYDPVPDALGRRRPIDDVTGDAK
jgi:putative membrane protein insertion efficiency factor